LHDGLCNRELQNVRGGFFKLIKHASLNSQTATLHKECQTGLFSGFFKCEICNRAGAFPPPAQMKAKRCPRKKSNREGTKKLFERSRRSRESAANSYSK